MRGSIVRGSILRGSIARGFNFEGFHCKGVNFEGFHCKGVIHCKEVNFEGFHWVCNVRRVKGFSSGAKGCTNIASNGLYTLGPHDHYTRYWLEGP